jgi:outer membrane scaffolding protein for murein synthesis (MipA/OmpV family)
VTRNRIARRALAGLAALAAAGPALAQEDAAAPEMRDDRNSLTIGLGGAMLPSYEGSDNYQLTPIGLAFGKVGGIGFRTRGTNLAIDLIPESQDAPYSIELGPLVHVRLDRTGGIKDPQVRALGEIDTAIEVGAVAGIAKNGVLHQYDSLGVRLQYQKDVSDTHDSWLMSPTIEYGTPLSTRTYVQLGLSAERVGDGYARTYFSITPGGALASGLPAYTAEGGWKSWRATLFLGQSITGDLRRPKLSAFAGAGYGRLLGDFKRSPIVATAGSPGQYFALAGLAYSF